MKLRRVVRVVAIASSVLLLFGILAIAGLRHVLANRLQGNGAAGIHEARYVTIGGQQQWIEIRGSDRANPVLLWLHGGPGFVVLPVNYPAFLAWEQKFTVVHWHQRGAGLTLAASTNDTPLTIGRMVDDGIEVAEYARRRLSKEKIVVVGHSWGSLLGVRMAERRPDLFSAYVGTGQFTNLRDDGRDLFEQAMAKARRESNARAIQALEAVAPLPPTDVHRMDVVRLWGRTEDVSDNRLLLYVGPLLSPGYPISDVLSFEHGIAKSRADLYAQELQVNLLRDVPKLQIPVFLLQGKDDWQVSTPSALRYFELLQAPKKQIVMLEGGHLIPFLQPQAFLEVLVEKVRPTAVQ